MSDEHPFARSELKPPKAGRDGIDTLRELRRRGDPIPVIILTTFEEPALFEQAVAAGARGFLRKDVSPEELLAAIESVHAGQTAYAPTASQAVRNAGQFTTPAGGADVPTLTERERSILRLMAGSYANREIASMELPRFCGHIATSVLLRPQIVPG